MRCGRLVLESGDGVVVAELRGLAEEEGVYSRLLPLAVDRDGALRAEEEEEVPAAGVLLRLIPVAVRCTARLYEDKHKVLLAVDDHMLTSPQGMSLEGAA